MKAKVCLINWTKNPIETMCYARRVMHSPVPDTLEEFMQNSKKWLGTSINKYVNNVLLKDGMPTFLEYIQLTFKFENVSRALQQQLTRHRIGFSYSIQSLRCVDLPKFADNYNYFNPNKKGTKEFRQYHQKMLNIQKEYNEAIKQGVPTQDARGLLPMNVYSTVTFSCSLRALIGMINKRLCWKTQGEFNHVAKLLIKELRKKVDKRILHWIGPPCKFGWCMMKGENEEQYKAKKFTGKQNTQYTCPIYIEKFKKINHERISNQFIRDNNDYKKIYKGIEQK